MVADLLAPGGRLFVREGHPMLWALDDTAGPDQPLALGHPYFEQPHGNVWDEPGSYVDDRPRVRPHHQHDWNHGLGEIVTALLDAGPRR